jgi:hypothetical protein
MLTTSIALSRLYQKKNVPINYIDENGYRVMSAGFHTTAMLHKHHYYQKPSEANFFDAIGATHNLHLLKRDGDKECNAPT